MPKPEKVSFPKPPIAADGSLMYERVPNKSDLIEKTPINCVVPPTTVKRRFDEVNGLERKDMFQISFTIFRISSE